MTDTEINIAIAEACGWKDRPDPYYYDHRQWTKDEGASWCATCDLPDYCHDLNAMNEAEEHISGETWAEYFTWLQTHGNATGVRATSHQRAEAFLRCLGKWRGE